MQPAIILIRPQLGENIGKTARAMLNFGLTDLRLVAPRDGWPNPDAGPTAAGAGTVLDGACVYPTVEAAIEDCNYVFATTVRSRDMPKSVASPHEAAAQMRGLIAVGQQPAIMFGPERSGMTNDDIALADTVLTVPINPEYGSLNLAQAVILIAYEYFQTLDKTPSFQPAHTDGLASKKELVALMEHFEAALTRKGYYRSAGRKATQRRMLRNVLQSAGFSSQEVMTLRGVVKSLARDAEE